MLADPVKALSEVVLNRCPADIDICTHVQQCEVVYYTDCNEFCHEPYPTGRGCRNSVEGRQKLCFCIINFEATEPNLCVSHGEEQQSNSNRITNNPMWLTPLQAWSR